MFPTYPYINVNDLNLDYLLRTIRVLEAEIKNFVNFNAIKYADPLAWNITTQYEGNTVVIDPATGIAYLSTQAVPNGVAITNTDYWTAIFDMSAFFADLGDINDLLTTDKSNVVNAINEVLNSIKPTIEEELYYVTPEMFGAVGDGVTDDTQAIKDALASGKHVQFKKANYLVTNTIDLESNALLITGVTCEETRITYTGGGYLFINVGEFSQVRKIQFAGNSTNNLMHGLIHRATFESVSIIDFDKAFYNTRTVWAGVNHFNEVRVARVNLFYSDSTPIRHNLYSFINCVFNTITTVFDVIRYEDWQFTSCDIEDCDDFILIKGTTIIAGINFVGCYFETGHILKDNGYRAFGSINIVGGWIYRGSTQNYLFDFTRANDDYRFIINLDNISIHSDTEIFNFTNKVRGRLTGYAYNTSYTGVSLSTLFTSEGGMQIVTTDSNCEEFSLPLRGTVRFNEGGDIGFGSVGLTSDHKALMFNIGQPTSVVNPKIIPVSVDTSLSNIQTCATGASELFGIDKNAGKLYVKINNVWYEVTKTTV